MGLGHITKHIGTIFICLIVFTMMMIVLENNKLASSNCSNLKLATETSKAIQVEQVATPEARIASGSADTIEEHDYLIPDDTALDRLNNTELTIIYWRYINTIQFHCRNQMRMGRMRDGGKEICVDKKYQLRKPCLVYSFGSNFDFSFERDIYEIYGCEIHTFDPSITMSADRRPTFTQFHKVGLGGIDGYTDRKHWMIRRLSSIVDVLKHKNRTIDLLKVDIEGSEWTALPDIFKSGDLQRVRQLCIEIHFNNNGSSRMNGQPNLESVALADKLRVFRQLYKEGFRIFMREHNVFSVRQFIKPYREITNANELSLVNINLEYGNKEFDYSRTFGDKASKFEVNV